MKLTKKKVESYMTERSGEELRHCPDAIANACNEMMRKFNNEFSGEIFKKFPTKDLVKHTDEETLLVNNHALYKWHFNRINKWNTEHCIFHNQHMWR